VNVVWYGISLFGTAVFVALGIGLHALLGGSLASFSAPQPWYVAFIAFPYVLLTSVLGEEIGWRGYALPRLQARYSALVASLILGLVWNLWHLPLFAMAGNFHQDLPLSLFLLQSLVLTLLMTWVYNHTRGSLLMAHLFHTASNVTFFMLPILPTETGGTVRPLWLALGIAGGFALVIVWVYGPERLAHGPVPTRRPYPAAAREES
jgi:membrane protease YdiL (CAAX protease family)